MEGEGITVTYRVETKIFVFAFSRKLLRNRNFAKLEKGIFVTILPSLRHLTQAELLFPNPIWCNTDTFGDPVIKKGNAVNAKTIFEEKIKREVQTTN
jgi:hypothetical protein